MIDWLLYENEAMEQGYKLVCGVDEAGRGPLAGPVFAAAVILPENIIIEGVNDSKKLSEKRRELLFEKIINTAASYSISYVDENEIDRINILKATHFAMKKAVLGLSISPDMVLVDGNSLPELPFDSRCIIKGDSLSQSIACASILAKVSRDRFMLSVASKYPEYEFEKHKGYGTKLHIEKILCHGPCPAHRNSFLTKILAKKR